MGIRPRASATWVGMIRSDQPPTGEAVSISRVLGTLREWKYPVPGELAPAVSPGRRRPRHQLPRDTRREGRLLGRSRFRRRVEWERGTLALAGGRFKSLGAECSMCALSASAEPPRKLGSHSTAFRRMTWRGHALAVEVAAQNTMKDHGIPRDKTTENPKVAQRRSIPIFFALFSLSL